MSTVPPSSSLSISEVNWFVYRTTASCLIAEALLISRWSVSFLYAPHISSKVISFPSHELFDNQSKKYRDKILNETKIKISIEAATIDSWKKYVGSKGLSFGINNFGKSAPYKDIYKYFNLDSKNITKKIIKYIKKN